MNLVNSENMHDGCNLLHLFLHSKTFFCEEAPDERGSFFFFRLQEYKRIGISLVEVYERVGNLSFQYVKMLKGLTNAFHGCENSRKRSAFVIYSHLKDSAFTAVNRDAKF